MKFKLTSSAFKTQGLLRRRSRKVQRAAGAGIQKLESRQLLAAAILDTPEVGTAAEVRSLDATPGRVLRIVNGMPTDGHEAVGIVNGQCSGTLIAPNVVLTAAHCVEGVSASRGSFEAGGANYGTSSMAIHPDYFTSDIDMALMFLNQNVAGVEPIEIFRSEPVVGQTLTIVGFGATGTGDSGHDGAFGVKHVGTTPIDEVTATEIRWTFDNNSEANTAPGDSGGPAFVEVDGQFFVAGVTSGGSRDDAAIGDVSYDIRVDAVADWIDQTIQNGGPLDGNNPGDVNPPGGGDPWGDPWGDGGGDPWGDGGGDPWGDGGGDPWGDGGGDPWGDGGGDPWGDGGGDPWGDGGGDPWGDPWAGDPWGDGGGDPWGDPWGDGGGDPWGDPWGDDGDPWSDGTDPWVIDIGMDPNGDFDPMNDPYGDDFAMIDGHDDDWWFVDDTMHPDLMDGDWDPDCPIDDLPIDDMPIDDMPIDDLPIDDLPIDDLPIDDLPIDDLPIDDMPIDDMPIDDLPIDDLPIDDLPIDDMPIDDMPIDDLPIDDLPIDDPIRAEGVPFDNTIFGEGTLDDQLPFEEDPFEHCDVDQDGGVDALDALQILNFLLRNEGGDGGTMDVNGDKRVTPTDALRVLNFIGRRTQRSAAVSVSSPRDEILVNPDDFTRSVDVAMTLYARDA